MGIKESFLRVDKIEENLEEVSTGNKFNTEIYELRTNDLSKLTKDNGWLFDWNKEFHLSARKCYKLVIENSHEIQGIISIEVKPDYLYLPLIESAPHNRGKNKKYNGALASLTAFACKKSFEFGYQGDVAFMAKTSLIQHYKNTLGATHFGGQRMGIIGGNARKLVALYFKNFEL